MEMLQQAEKAYHDLMLGKSVAEVRDGNGEMIRYTAANRGALASYISELRRQLGVTTVGPLTVWG